MVVEGTTKHRGGAGRRVGGRGTRGTSKKGKQQGDSSESSEARSRHQGRGLGGKTDTEYAQGR